MRSNDEENKITNDGATIVSKQLAARNEKEAGPEQQQTLMDKIRFVGVFAAIVMSMFVMSLNSTVVAPAMSIIATQLDALEQQTWIATSFMVAVIAFQPLSGKFSDIFGRKPILVLGQSFFLLGSLIAALSPTIEGVIAGRTIQGFGAGGLFSMLFVVVSDIASPKLRPRLQSMLTVIYGLSSVVGPLIGGAFVDYLTWRWDFWINIIVCGVAVVLILVMFKESVPVLEEPLIAKIKRIDGLGILFSISCVTCLLLAVSWGPLYGWGNPHSVASFVVAGVTLALLIISQGWISKEPVMPASVLLRPSVFTVYIYMGCLGLGFVGTLYFGPILFQSVYGASSTQSGIRLIPFMVCLIGGSMGSSILLQYFPYFKGYIVFGACCNVIGYGLFYTVNEHSSWGHQAGFLTFCGFAFGLSQQNCILAVQTAADKKDMAVATSLTNFFMMLASSIGIAVYQTLFSTFLKAQISELDPETIAIGQEVGALENYLYIRKMPVEAQGPLIHAYMEALHDVFIVPLGAAGVGVVASLFLRNVRYEVTVPNHSPSPQTEEMKEVTVTVDEEESVHSKSIHSIGAEQSQQAQP